MDNGGAIPKTAARPLLLVWASWILGPACFVFCAERNDGEPDCLLAFLAVAGHVAAVLLIAAMTGWARFRHLPEYWLMLGYWIPLAGLFLGMAIESLQLARVSMLTVLGWAGLVPLAGAVRLILILRRVASRR